MEREPRARDVVFRALREAPPQRKRAIALALVMWTGIFILQLFDVRGRLGPRATAEVASVLLGTAGIFLVGLLQLLRHAGDLRPAGGSARPAPDTAAVRQVLLALPIIGFTAGALLAAAIASVVARMLLGTSPLVLFVATIHLFFLVAAASIVNGATRQLYRHGQEQAERVTRAEGQLVEARLTALQAQMNPHFLFNALNTVASLVRTDPRAAEATVENLAGVLRRTLERSQRTTGTLADEIDHVRAYLSIETERFRDRLRVDWAIAPDTLAALVPPLSIQPLVENAVKYSVGPRGDGARIRIAAKRAGARLLVSVEDDGEGFARDWQEGTGLGNLRARLTGLYGPAASMTIQSSGSGACVRLELPFELQPETGA